MNVQMHADGWRVMDDDGFMNLVGPLAGDRCAIVANGVFKSVRRPA